MVLYRNDRCNRIGSRYNSWENPLMMKELMAKDYEVGAAGSLTMIVLFSSVVFLLRSFYKRYTRLQQNAEQMRENEDDN